MKVTIEQIAKMCNVSRGTVDRVLHNRPYVHPQIRRNVLSALARTGYRSPSQIEKCTVRHTAGVILPGWPDRYFFRHSQRGIRTALAKTDKREFSLIIEQLAGRSVGEHAEAIDRLLAQGVEGVILNAPMENEITSRLNRAADKGVRIVTCMDELPQCPAAFYVGQDVARAGRVAGGLMAKYLRPGERVLAVSGDMQFYSHRKRVESFEERVGELIPPSQAVHEGRGIVTIVFCNEIFQETARTVHHQLRMDEHIRYIYMATQSVSGCIEGIRRAQLPYKITVICNDTTAAARRFLASGDVDFVIGQSVARTAAQAVESMYQMLCLGIEPRAQRCYTGLAIYTQQMLQRTGEQL